MNNALFYLQNLILKSEQNIIELVTGPGTSHPLCSGEVERLLLDWRRSPEFPCPITTARRILLPPTTAMFLIKSRLLSGTEESVNLWEVKQVFWRKMVWQFVTQPFVATYCKGFMSYVFFIVKIYSEFQLLLVVFQDMLKTGCFSDMTTFSSNTLRF